MSSVLNCCYLIAIALASPFLSWQAWRHGKYRHGWRQKLFGLVERPKDDRPVVWVHAVSVGEVKLAGKIVSALCDRLPWHQFVISTTSQTGYELACRELGQHQVTYAPLDFSWAVKRAINRLQPEALVLVELEMWPNLITAAHRFGAPIFIANGRLSASSFRGYQRFGRWMQRLLEKVTWIGAQDECYAERFRRLGATTCAVTGSIKFDDLQTDRANAATRSLVETSGLEADDLLFMAGSTQPEEDEIVTEVFARLRREFPALKLVLVPRHPENFETACQVVQRLNRPWCRWSELSDAVAGDWDIMVVDAIGILGAWWGRADVAFVGGSLCDRGGQNMIEPAAFGAAVCFGPNTINFQTTSDALIAHAGAFVVEDGEALESFVRRCVVDAEYRRALGTAATHWVRRQAGALDRTCDVIVGRLKRAPNRLAA